MGIMFYIVPIFIVLVFIFIFSFMFSPKLRGKMMSKQIKSMKYMIDESRDDIESITTTMANTNIKSMKNVMDNSKDDIENISTNMANANKKGIEVTARAIKKGLTEDEGTYCKHCGSKIDEDSIYCKKCGKKQ